MRASCLRIIIEEEPSMKEEETEDSLQEAVILAETT